MRMVIEATDLPGGDVRVGVQRKGRPDEVLDPAPGDAAGATWTVECRVRGDDVTGPYVEGRPGARFVYRSWSRDGAMFRRAKLMLDAVPTDVLRAAERSGSLCPEAYGACWSPRTSPGRSAAPSSAPG